jgi:hypothetical protein
MNMSRKDEKTERIAPPVKFFRMATRNGNSYRFDAQDYEAAQEWSRKQIEALGLVYPKDLSDLQEEK